MTGPSAPMPEPCAPAPGAGAPTSGRLPPRCRSWPRCAHQMAADKHVPLWQGCFVALLNGAAHPALHMCCVEQTVSWYNKSTAQAAQHRLYSRPEDQAESDFSGTMRSLRPALTADLRTVQMRPALQLWRFQDINASPGCLVPAVPADPPCRQPGRLPARDPCWPSRCCAVCSALQP